MGIRRGVTTSPENPAVNQDIVLDMHLDLSVPVVIDTPINIGGLPAANNLYAYLDLGAEGYIPNPHNWASGKSGSSSVFTTGTSLAFPSFPRLDGTNFVFLDQATNATGGYPVSYYYRRQPGDLSQGVTLGPLLPTSGFTRPTALTGFDGTISWASEPGPTPDIHQLLMLKPTLAGTVTAWSVVLPGAEQQVVLPSAALQQLQALEAGNTLFLVLLSSRSPKFSYAQWTYDTLSEVNWSSFTIGLSDPFAP
jgi:hypothetical protein